MSDIQKIIDQIEDAILHGKIDGRKIYDLHPKELEKLAKLRPF